MGPSSADEAPEQAREDCREQRRENDDEVQRRHPSAPHRVEIFDVDAPALPEQHDKDGEADGGFGSRDGENEKHEYLPAQVPEIARKGDEIEVHGEQHQLYAHQEQNDVLAVEEDPRHRDREQDAGQHQEVRQADHGRFSDLILASETRSTARTATCAAMSWTLCPARRRIVSAMAATMAISRMTAASCSGDAYSV